VSTSPRAVENGGQKKKKNYQELAEEKRTETSVTEEVSP
jgi:hypothetical protein